MLVLTLLVFTKNIYIASISSYYTFYVIQKFGVSVQQVADDAVPVPRRSAAVGILLGGPIGDRSDARR